MRSFQFIKSVCFFSSMGNLKQKIWKKDSWQWYKKVWMECHEEVEWVGIPTTSNDPWNWGIFRKFSFIFSFKNTNQTNKTNPETERIRFLEKVLASLLLITIFMRFLNIFKIIMLLKVLKNVFMILGESI